MAKKKPKLEWYTNAYGSDVYRKHKYGAKIRMKAPLESKDVIIGEPKATTIKTVDELKAEGFIGLYRKVKKKK